MNVMIDYSVKDQNWEFCKECNIFVCGNCDCSVYHLDYQLALWGDVGMEWDVNE